MKTIVITGIAILTLLMAGCEKETTRYIEVPVAEDLPPAVPQGVYSITGNEAVYIYWLPVQDDDLAYYRVWWSPDDDLYELMGTTTNEYYFDYEVNNGETYYYAVSAVDDAGHESALSYETVFDTPRPEGATLLTDFYQVSSTSGFDFSAQARVPYNSIAADIYLEFDPGLQTFFINVGDVNTDIQDMGYTYDFDEIGYSPGDGWSAVGWSEIILYHTYIIWTNDNHFAKIRVININGTSSVEFQWAYQTAYANPELARPQHDEDYLKRTIEGIIIK
ncbi:MAG: hypothetical protein AB1746_11480 [Candidatus Zixiibacteriota bacterium]